MPLKIKKNENKLKNLQKVKNLSGKKNEMHPGFPEIYSEITFTTNSTFVKIVLILKKHGKVSSCEY